MFGVGSALGAWGRWPIDASRAQIESMPAEGYLRSAYYEKRLPATLASAVRHGLITQAEAATGRPDPSTPKAKPPLTAGQVDGLMKRGSPTVRAVERQPVFLIGDAVRTRNIHPATHTRLPRYAQDKPGVIVVLHGAHVFPDTNALFQGENPQPFYTVKFRARVLWGEAASPRDTVCIDLWEHYLELAR
jgi:nitrile hydratase subunit beta